MNTILILGNGKIGTAFKKLLDALLGKSNTINDIAIRSPLRGNFEAKLVDVYGELGDSPSAEHLASYLKKHDAKLVVNALPFFLSERAASAAKASGCHYIDFTEDDQAASGVYEIFKGTNLTCAPKCGVAPGFINYVGADLASKIHAPETLLMTVGALPQHINYSEQDIDGSYNLSWSVDGLVNEYLKPCRVRMNGRDMQVPALTCQEKVVLHGQEYEAAFTSGGAGTLIEDLKHVPNVFYKTLRYPGHFTYVKAAIKRHHASFEKLRQEFLSIYPYNDNDVVTVFATCTGRDGRGSLVKNTYHENFYGACGLSAIQTITAASALAVLELMVQETVKGGIRHKDIKIEDLHNTASYSFFFRNRR